MHTYRMCSHSVSINYVTVDLHYAEMHTERRYTHGDNLFGNSNPTIMRDSTKAQSKILLCLRKYISGFMVHL